MYVDYLVKKRYRTRLKIQLIKDTLKYEIDLFFFYDLLVVAFVIIYATKPFVPKSIL